MCVIPTLESIGSDDGATSCTTVGSLRSDDLDSAYSLVSRSVSQSVSEDRRPPLESCSIDSQIGSIVLHPVDSKGIARLVVKMRNAKVVTQYNIKMFHQHLDCTLQRLHYAGASFVATYDLRSCIPAPPIAQALGRLHVKYADMLSHQLKAMGLLVADNLFTLASKGRVGSFIIESCLPACPKAILHSERIAERFFQATCDSSSTAYFVSMAGVHTASDSQPGSLESCVATLVPLKSSGSRRTTNTPEVGHALPNAPMIHTLENGDVRVIQSAATDVMLRPADHGPNHANPQEGSDDAEDGSDQAKQPTKVVSEQPEMSPGDLQMVEALKFRGSAAKLKQYVGMQFHIGELTIDADAASSILRGPAKMCGDAKSRKPRRSVTHGDSEMRSEAFATGVLNGCGCWAGIAWLSGY